MKFIRKVKFYWRMSKYLLNDAYKSSVNIIWSYSLYWFGLLKSITATPSKPAADPDSALNEDISDLGLLFGGH